jgi:hypothetical protein
MSGKADDLGIAAITGESENRISLEQPAGENIRIGTVLS